MPAASRGSAIASSTRRITRATRRPRPPTSCPTTRTERDHKAAREARYPRSSRHAQLDKGNRSCGGHVEVEIGIGKSGRRAYGFDEIAIVPSRRTRDPEDVDITWEV